MCNFALLVFLAVFGVGLLGRVECLQEQGERSHFSVVHEGWETDKAQENDKVVVIDDAVGTDKFRETAKFGDTDDAVETAKFRDTDDAVETAKFGDTDDAVETAKFVDTDDAVAQTVSQLSRRQDKALHYDSDELEPTADIFLNEDEAGDVGTRQGRSYRQVYRPNSGRNFAGIGWFNGASIDVPAVECAATNGALDMGTCFTEPTCNANGGVASGVCPSGGVCCIFPTVCGGTVSRNRTWFVNKDFPDYSGDSSNCQLTIQRTHSRIRQLRLDFVVAELGDAVQGRCSRDRLTVRRANSLTDLMPALCGDNTGQHVYLEFGFQNLELMIRTESNLRRKWHILVTQVAPGQEAPQGCLQYYSERAATLKSLNYNSGSYLFKGDLDYDICFPAIQSNNRPMLAGCQRKTFDIDLRQSENDIRTRRGRFSSRRGRSSRAHTLPIVMAFQKERQQRITRSNSPRYTTKRGLPTRTHPRSMPSMYSLLSDPVYGQIDSVVGQLQSPSNSGLESLLNSKSQLDEMKEKFTEQEAIPDDTYYYYYYEDDNGDFISNNLDGSNNEQATDNYAVEHMHREFVVLPDGSPIPGNYYVHNDNKPDKTEHTTDAFNSNKYFHTGMIKDITEYNTGTTADDHYPTPTYFQRPTSSPVNLLKPSHPVASIMVYDPHSFAPDSKVTYADPYRVNKNAPANESPSMLTFNDLTTLSSINPDDEYILKHDGVQWLFLKNDKVTPSPTFLPSTSSLILPHDIKISPGRATTVEANNNTPHLVFKHPSGTVTEMHISSENEHKPNEKIVTVIETGPVTQNYTKIKLNHISELDKVIENVFNIVSESNEISDSQFTDMTQPTTLPSYLKTTYPFSDINGNSQTPVETTFYALTNNKESSPNGNVLVVTHPHRNGLVSEDLKLSQGYMTANDDNHITTIFNRIKATSSAPQNINTQKPTKIIHRYTTRPDSDRFTSTPELTRMTTQPKVTRITNRPQVRITKIVSPTRGAQTTRFTKMPTTNRVTPFYQPTTPSSVPAYTISQNPAIRYTKRQQAHSPIMGNIKKIPVTAPSSVSITNPSHNGIRAQHVFTTIQNDNTKPTFTSVQENSNIIQGSTGGTFVPVVMQTSGQQSDPFSTMLNNLGVKETTPKPLFTISTTSNGIITTKSYTNVEEALEDLSKVTDAKLNTVLPYSVNGDPTTPIPQSIKLDGIGTDSSINEVTVYNNEICEDSYIKVNNVKVCDQLLRSESVRDEAQRLFTNMERVSVRSLGNSASPLRFSITYDTVCPAESPAPKMEYASQTGNFGYHTSTTRQPQVETINLLQYLLGWY